MNVWPLWKARNGNVSSCLEQKEEEVEEVEEGPGEGPCSKPPSQRKATEKRKRHGEESDEEGVTVTTIRCPLKATEIRLPVLPSSLSDRERQREQKAFMLYSRSRRWPVHRNVRIASGSYSQSFLTTSAEYLPPEGNQRGDLLGGMVRAALQGALRQHRTG